MKINEIYNIDVKSKAISKPVYFSVDDITNETKSSLVYNENLVEMLLL